MCSLVCFYLAGGLGFPKRFISCLLYIKDIHYTDQCYDFIIAIRKKQEDCEKSIVHRHLTMNVQLCEAMNSH